MKENNIKQNSLVPFTLLGALIIGVYFGLLEPLLTEWVSLNAGKKDTMVKLVELRKNYSEEAGSRAKNTGSKNDIFIMNYLDALTLKSDINKVKSFQPIGLQGAKGVPSYQIRFACNANALLKFMYLAEETQPRLAISNCRASSIAGGSYGGMRQLECLATISLVAKGNESKINIAETGKFKAVGRDPFSEVVKAEPRKERVVETPSIPEVTKWILTAVMSEGEADVLLFKKESGGEKFTVSLKKSGAISLSWVNEQVELKIGEEKLLWGIGESKSEDTLPKELVDNIKNGESAKGGSEKSFEAPKSSDAPTFEELNRFGQDDVPQNPRGGRSRGLRSGPR